MVAVSGIELDWPGSRPQFLGVLVSAVVLYLAMHYGLSKTRFREWLKAQGRDDATAQALSVLWSKAGGGILLAVGSLVTLAATVGNPLDYGVRYIRWGPTLLYPLVCAAAILPVLVWAARSSALQEQYPEIRSEHFTKALATKSAGSWAVYLLGYELYFRGFLLFYLAQAFGVWPALALTTALYTFVHLPKRAAETVSCLLMGFVFGALAIETGGFLAPFLLHWLIAVTSENAAARANPSIRFWGH
jgi:membrane protease YdiL (CAAX protease family)